MDIASPPARATVPSTRSDTAQCSPLLLQPSPVARDVISGVAATLATPAPPPPPSSPSSTTVFSSPNPLGRRRHCRRRRRRRRRSFAPAMGSPDGSAGRDLRREPRAASAATPYPSVTARADGSQLGAARARTRPGLGRRSLGTQAVPGPSCVGGWGVPRREGVRAGGGGRRGERLTGSDDSSPPHGP